MIELQRTTEDTYVTLDARGRLDASSVSTVEAELDDIVRHGLYDVRLGMQAVEYISSAGVRVLVKYYKTLKQLGGGLRICAVSDTVLAVLRMGGLGSLFDPAARTAAPAAGPAPPATLTRHTFGDCSISAYPPAAAPALACRVIGDAQVLTGSATPAVLARMAIARDRLVLGIGACGRDAADCRPRCGELLAVSGAVAYLPTDADGTPDYLLASATIQPDAHVLYALQCDGVLGLHARFETAAGQRGTPVSQIAQALLTLCAAEQIAFVMIAESAGLIGAALRRAPTAAGGAQFSFPDIRDWLAFTPEHAHERALALVVGIVARDAPACLQPFLRPLASPAAVLGHMHAAVFDYRALPQGPLALHATVHTLFQEQSLRGMLHLLHDPRAIAGTDESMVVRGALWASPLGSITLAGSAP
ncbi:MAG: STAS domain-containing protein [bacterium]|nr:STAS domain-containing protein [bacterium]